MNNFALQMNFYSKNNNIQELYLIFFIDFYLKKSKIDEIFIL